MVDDTPAPGADQVRQVAVVKHLGCDPCRGAGWLEPRASRVRSTGVFFWGLDKHT